MGTLVTRTHGLLFRHWGDAGVPGSIRSPAARGFPQRYGGSPGAVQEVFIRTPQQQQTRSRSRPDPQSPVTLRAVMSSLHTDGAAYVGRVVDSLRCPLHPPTPLYPLHPPPPRDADVASVSPLCLLCFILIGQNSKSPNVSGFFPPPRTFGNEHRLETSW